MIRLEASDSGLIIHPIPQSPIVYLDQCVLLDMARDRSIADQFITTLISKGGTLYLSITHMLETGGLDPKGSTYLGLKALLERIGPHWGLVESDAAEVMLREQRFSAEKIPPQQDSQMLKEIILSWDGLSVPSPALAINNVSTTPELAVKYKDLHAEHKQALWKLFDKARRDYQNNPQAKANLDGRVYNSRPNFPPTEFIYWSLMRETIRTHEAFTEKDGPDFEHAVVSMAYSDFVVLDKKWTRRLRGLGIPPKAAKLYDVTELDQFLADFAKYQR